MAERVCSFYKQGIFFRMNTSISISISSFNDSIFIPVVGGLTEQDIISIFWNGFIGSVRRVDFFVSPNGKRAAFVHFTYWLNNNLVNYMWNEIELYGSFKFWYCSAEYLIIRRMTCEPIPDTEMNIHQVAAKLSEQEEQLALLETKSQEQEYIIASLQKRLADEGILEQQMVDRDEAMICMVNSLVGPRWPDEDDTNMACVYPEDSD
uniref:Uncharacterized protein n=1 Tax=viral metagenome TaxID=1070528 RepID=A0A6C0B1A3_9ZZZZ